MTRQGGHESEQVCPYCGQPLRSREARRRLRDAEESLPDEQDRESDRTAAQRAHDLRVQTRIF
jgi:hypothetical protein